MIVHNEIMDLMTTVDTCIIIIGIFIIQIAKQIKEMVVLKYRHIKLKCLIVLRGIIDMDNVKARRLNLNSFFLLPLWF